jgi:hypothetical protein
LLFSQQGSADIIDFLTMSSGKAKEYAADVNGVQRLGGDDVTTPSARTDEQTEIALFWSRARH